MSGINTGSQWLVFVAGCCRENDFNVTRIAWIGTLSDAALKVTQCNASKTSKGGSCFLKLGGGEERGELKRKIEMARRISRSVTLCNRWVVGIHLPRERDRQGERENALHGLQWDFSNYLLLHIWMRRAMRGLEACMALLLSENHLQGDFKNISIMFQDKSLITGNYGLPISALLSAKPALLPHPRYFYPLIQHKKHRGGEGRDRVG